MLDYVKNFFKSIIKFLFMPQNQDFITLRGIIVTSFDTFFSPNSNNNTQPVTQTFESSSALQEETTNTEDFEETVLDRAVAFNQPNAVKKLIKAGADVNAVDNNNLTPLWHAVHRNVDLSIIDALVTAGANVNKLDERGHTLLHNVIENNKIDVLIILLRKADIDMRIKTPRIVNNDYTLLHYAIEYGSDLSIIQALIDAGADVNAIADPEKDGSASGGRDRRTPLQLAILKQNVEAIKALAAFGAKIDKPIVENTWLQGDKNVTSYHEDLFAFALSWRQVDMQNQPLPIRLPTLWALHDIGVRIDSEKTYKKILEGRQFGWPVEKWQFIRPVLFSYKDPNCLAEQNRHIIDHFNAHSQALSLVHLDNIKGSFYWWALQIFKAKNDPNNKGQNPFIEFCNKDGDRAGRRQILTMLWGTSELSNSIIKAIDNKLATNKEPFARSKPMQLT